MQSVQVSPDRRTITITTKDVVAYKMIGNKTEILQALYNRALEDDWRHADYLRHYVEDKENETGQ